MRKLVFKDSFKMAKIIKKANIKDEIAELTQKISSNRTDVAKVGIEVAITLFSALGDEQVEKEVCEWLNDVFEVGNVEEMPLDEIGKHFSQLAKENNLQGFFKLASQ